MSHGELAKRVGVAAVGIPLVVALAFLGGLALTLFLAAFAAVAAWELGRMYRGRELPAFPVLSGVLAFTIVLIAAGSGPGRFSLWAPLAALGLATPVVLRAPAEARPGIAGAAAVFAAFYAGGLIAFAIWLRGLDGGTANWRGAAILLLPVVATWLGDSAAYFAGRTLGRRPMAPVTSPNKTWEGAVAGVAGTVIATLVFVELTRPLVGWTLPLVGTIAFGVLIAVAGQAGDLVESRLKRDCAAKDSSTLLPGHGGFLDRLDSLLFVFPVSYAYLRVVGV